MSVEVRYFPLPQFLCTLDDTKPENTKAIVVQMMRVEILLPSNQFAFNWPDFCPMRTWFSLS